MSEFSFLKEVWVSDEHKERKEKEAWEKKGGAELSQAGSKRDGRTDIFTETPYR